MATVNFVGFWPWSRVWATKEAGDLAATLPKSKGGVSLTRELTSDEALVFRQVAVGHDGGEFEAQLCADGLLTYRHKAREEQIAAEWELAKADITQGMPASGRAWPFYVGALNIVFVLLESELHNTAQNRNHTIYWREPVARTDVVRVRYDDAGVFLGHGFYGPQTEMAIVRFHGPRSVGARVDGTYYPDLVGAFQDAMQIFDAAHADSALWSFLEVYASAWTLHAIEQTDAAVMLAWSLIERDMVQRLAALLPTIPVGNVLTQWPGSANPPTALNPGAEADLRAKITAGESPMAGRMIGALTGNGQVVDAETMTIKQARDRLAHGGARASFGESKAGLVAANSIAQRAFGIRLSPHLMPNPHLGLT
jgi:hypothetical protein